MSESNRPVARAVPPAVPPPVPVLPTAPGVGTINYAPPPVADDTLEIAKAQRNLMFCILAYLGCYVILGLGAATQTPTLALVGVVCVLACLLTAALLVFRMARKVYNLVAAILLTLGLIVPLINLLILLVVNGRATNILRRRGFKVGLLGVSAAQLRGRGLIIPS